MPGDGRAVNAGEAVGAAGRGRMYRNVGLLSACWALTSTSNVVLATVSALAGYQLADDKALATLPATMMWIGTASATLPASFLMRRIGRRAGFMIGAVIGAAGALIATLAILYSNFYLLCAGVALNGVYNAFNYYYRFAGAEVADEAFRARAISLVLAGGVIGALAGPELSKWAGGLTAPVLFLGPFMTMAALATAVLAIVGFVDAPRSGAQARGGGRPLAEIARQPAFVVAVLGAIVAYGVMVLLMTVTPVAMIACGHDFADATFVIQWHVLGMFAPSFFTGHLIRRFGILAIMASGALLLAACCAVALSGLAVTNFWIALALLGLGWNFLYVGATTLLTEVHTSAERAKVQGANEFMVFGVAGVDSFFSGNLHFYFGWETLNLIALAPAAAALAAVLWLARHRRMALADPIV